jgi:hypothetical protein
MAPDWACARRQVGGALAVACWGGVPHAVGIPVVCWQPSGGKGHLEQEGKDPTNTAASAARARRRRNRCRRCRRRRCHRSCRHCSCRHCRWPPARATQHTRRAQRGQQRAARGRDTPPRGTPAALTGAPAAGAPGGAARPPWRPRRRGGCRRRGPALAARWARRCGARRVHPASRHQARGPAGWTRRRHPD